MRTLILALFIPFWLIAQSYAQEIVKVEQTIINHAEGNIPAIKVNIYQANKEDVIKDWGRQVISETDKKSRKKPIITKNDYAIDSIKLSQISDNPINLISIFMQHDWGVEMMTALKLNGKYLDSTYKLEYQRASRFIKDFASSKYHDAVEVEL